MTQALKCNSEVDFKSNDNATGGNALEIERGNLVDVRARESFATAKTDVYRSPIGKGPKPTKSKSVSYLITDAYYNRAMQAAMSGSHGRGSAC